jgi:N-acyl-D-amino-acid deacylase
MKKFNLLVLLFLFFISCKNEKPANIILIKNGTIYDGSGNEPFIGDILIENDTIAAIEKPNVPSRETWKLRGGLEVDAKGMAVAPGFINMLSWSTETLIADGRSMSELKQGITLEVMGEGNSMGPINDSMRLEAESSMSDLTYKIEWKTLSGYLDWLTKRGISCNVASFIGAATVRENVLGSKNVAPNKQELDKMKALVRQAMEEGAMGVGSALIYAPGFYAKTDELVELCKVAAQYDGMYISHMRSEGNRFAEAVEELIKIANDAKIRAEIYHLKAAGKQNWGKLDKIIAKIDSANKAGLHISTDMYTYIAGATGLDASMPPSVQEGGYNEWAKRLKDPKIRQQVMKEMTTPTDKWENLFMGATPKGMLLVGFKSDSLRYLIGKTLEEAAKIYGKSPEETIIDLVVKDGSRVEVVYFLMNEDNVKKQLKLPYMSFGSDAGSQAPEGVFLKSSPHPRSYGNFARVLGKYVRDEKVISLQEAIYKLTALPAAHLKIKKRGILKVGNYADITVFDPLSIQDHATFEKPHQYATGMQHVFVNGVQVLKNGEHTNAKPGRVVYGPGKK